MCDLASVERESVETSRKKQEEIIWLKIENDIVIWKILVCNIPIASSDKFFLFFTRNISSAENYWSFKFALVSFLLIFSTNETNRIKKKKRERERDTKNFSCLLLAECDLNLPAIKFVINTSPYLLDLSINKKSNTKEMMNLRVKPYPLHHTPFVKWSISSIGPSPRPSPLLDDDLEI